MSSRRDILAFGGRWQERAVEGGKRFLAAVLPLRSGRRGIQNGDVRSDKFSANVPGQESPLASGMAPAREAESAGGMPEVPEGR